MLAWVCDLIVASDDAFFQDPVVRMGIPGVECFAHAHELHPRIARSSCCWASACRQSAPIRWAWSTAWFRVPSSRIRSMPWPSAWRPSRVWSLALTKMVVNKTEELQGLRSTMDMAFGYHHFAHAHSPGDGHGATGRPGCQVHGKGQ